MWKSGGKIKKEQWLLLALAGAALMILGTPVKKENDGGSLYESGNHDNAGIDLRDGEQGAEEAGGKAVHSSADESGLYEAQMEERIRSILKHVDGVCLLYTSRCV